MAVGDWWDLPANAQDAWDIYSGQRAVREAGEAVGDALQSGVDATADATAAQAELLDPYVQAGYQSLEQQQALNGSLGPEAQQAAYDQIQNSPGFQSAVQQGEQGILQNASATGGLRGGNTQGALAQFRPQMLNSAINQRYGQLGGITGIGQASAAGVGAAGMQGALSNAGLYSAMGDANAASILGQYDMGRQAFGDVTNFGKDSALLFLRGIFGGGSPS